MRIIDCKEKTCNNITKNAPLMIDNISQEEKEHFEKVKRLLDAAGVKYVVNPNIVRGLDYYTKTAFEFVSKHIGSQAMTDLSKNLEERISAELALDLV